MARSTQLVHFDRIRQCWIYCLYISDAIGRYDVEINRLIKKQERIFSTSPVIFGESYGKGVLWLCARITMQTHKTPVDLRNKFSENRFHSNSNWSECICFFPPASLGFWKSSNDERDRRKPMSSSSLSYSFAAVVVNRSAKHVGYFLFIIFYPDRVRLEQTPGQCLFNPWVSFFFLYSVQHPSKNRAGIHHKGCKQK